MALLDGKPEGKIKMERGIHSIAAGCWMDDGRCDLLFCVPRVELTLLPLLHFRRLLGLGWAAQLGLGTRPGLG